MKDGILKKVLVGCGGAHFFNPSTWEAESGGSESSRPSWSTLWVPRQPGLGREIND